MPIDEVWKAERFAPALTRVEVFRLEAFRNGALRQRFPARHALKMGAWERQLVKKQPVLRGFGRRRACVGHHGFVSKPRVEGEADAPGIPRRRLVGPGRRT